MRQFLTAALAALALAGCATQPAPQIVSAPAPSAPAPAASPEPDKPAPLSELVKAVDVPFERFTLPNGLTTLIHTDRKTPIVGVTVYYRVGSKHEPRGKTGFAHLYEHLFFGGSENVPNFDIPLEAAGSSSNGSTWYDRTNYVETVPKGALEMALFLESDRMGHLLGAVTQDKLDKQRGVVQNEKRQGDNQPYGLTDYAIGDGLFPVGHPYRHSTIGSMADLNAASLGDVRQWFRDNYGPNNVVLALSGDVDATTARPLVEKYFGHIPRGPEVPKVVAEPVTLPAPLRREMTDQVPLTRVTRNWSGPGMNHPDAPALTVAMYALGGLGSSRLDNILVRDEQLADSVSASNQAFEQIGFLQVSMDVKDGVDTARAEKRFDEIIASFLDQGPTRDEALRAATSAIVQQIGALEVVGGFSGKGAMLAEGQLYSNDPVDFRKFLDRMAAVTPAEARDAARKWMGRPAFSLLVKPGTRTEKGESMGGWGDEGSSPPPKPDARRPAPRLTPGPKRAMPPVAPVGDFAFPQIEHATLSNGMKVTLARRNAIPMAGVWLIFDSGFAADSLDTPGTQAMLMDMLDEGTTSRKASQIAEEQERLGASISTASQLETAYVSMGAPVANLKPSLALMSDIVRNPAFADDDFARVRDQTLATLAQNLSTPDSLARRELISRLYGPGHPYAHGADGLGNAEDIKHLTTAAMRAAHAKWMRPDLAEFYVAGDIEMAQLLPLLEASFGDWKAPAEAAPVKNIAVPVPPARPRIILIDRPNSPQSVILGGRILPRTSRDAGFEPIDLANQVLGNGFLSRLNLNLREDKGWSYGVSSTVRNPRGQGMFRISAPVQADRTGDALRLILADMKAFPARKPVTAEELNRVTEGNIRNLPSQFETMSQVLDAILANRNIGRPDNYQASLPSLYRSIDAKALNQAAREWLQPDQLTFVVVGERKVVEPQLRRLGLPIEFVAAPETGH